MCYASTTSINSKYPGQTGGMITLAITDSLQVGFQVEIGQNEKGNPWTEGLLPEGVYGFSGGEQS